MEKVLSLRKISMVVGLELIRLDIYKGTEAIFYSVAIDGSDDTLFDEFLDKHINDYLEELRFIDNRIRTMNEETGAREQFFKLNEGKLGDGVAAIYDLPSKRLRLYCIRFGSTTVILGGGGLKKTRTHQEDPELKEQADMMIHLSKMISIAIKEKEIHLNPDGTFSGNLRLEE